MLASFARAVQAQAHSCSCRACSHAAGSISGKSISRPARRKVSIADAFTACYTTIFATAAVLDASAKQKRRDELDERIRVARAKVLQLVDDRTSHEVQEYKDQVRRSAVAAAEPESEPMHAIASICLSRNQLRRTEDIFDRHAKSADRLRSRLVGRFQGHFGLDRRKAQSPNVDFDRIRTAIMAEEESFLARREPKTDVHMDRTSRMINKLVDELLLQALRQDDKREPGLMKRHLQMLDSAWGYMKMLRHEGYPKFAPVEGQEEVAQVRGELNAANERVMVNHWRPDRVRVPVAKICYNLTVSKFPPSIHNYNALIAAFLRAGEISLSEVVVDSFLNDSQFLPTQQTIVCLLNHYSMSHNLLGYYGIIRRLVGIDQRGMRIRQVGLSAVSHSVALQNWASTSEVTISKEYFVQRAELDFDVADALVGGLLSFDRLEHAAKVFIASLQQKIDIDVSTLVALVKACLTSLDYFASRLVLDGLLQNLADTLDLIWSQGSVMAVKSIKELISFCYPSWRRAKNIQSDRLSTLTRAMQLKEAQDWFIKVGGIAEAINRILRASVHDWDYRTSASLALWERSQRQRRKRAAHAALAEQVYSIGMLEQHCLRLEIQSRETEFELLAVLAEHSPFKDRRNLRDMKRPLKVRLQEHLETRALAPFTVRTQVIGYLVRKAETKTRALVRDALPSLELERLTAYRRSACPLPISEPTKAQQRTLGPCTTMKVERGVRQEPQKVFGTTDDHMSALTDVFAATAR
jgi:hypothetical protein